MPKQPDLTIDMLFEKITNSPYRGIVAIDKQETIIYINPTMAEIFNIKLDEAIGQKLTGTNFDPGLKKTLRSGKNELIRMKIDDLIEYSQSIVPTVEPFLAPIVNDEEYESLPVIYVSRHPIFINDKIVGAYGIYELAYKELSTKSYTNKEYVFLVDSYTTSDKIPNTKLLTDLVIKLNTGQMKQSVTGFGIHNILGTSLAIQDLKQKVLITSQSPSTILITGESGTGKELFAKAIHTHGNRSTQPFIAINCSAIPESLLESELFGYEKGSFTGGLKHGKIGKFELANGGTLFLDEIGDMPLTMQTKVLRVLQEREVVRIGGQKSTPLDIRIITATNVDLKAKIKDGLFRQDLFYRLNVINLHIPPLRERKEDITVISQYLVRHLNKELGQNIKGLSPKALIFLKNYSWPGNVRELINVLEAAMNFCNTFYLEPNDFSFYFDTVNSPLDYDSNEDLRSYLDQAEKDSIISCLKQTDGNQSKAAILLGISRSSLYRKIKKYNIEI